MKKITLLWVLCLITFMGATTAQAQTLLCPGFESEDFADAWIIDFPDLVSVVSNDHYSEIKSCKLIVNEMEETAIGQTVESTVGKSYTISTYCKLLKDGGQTAGKENATAQLGYYFKDENGESLTEPVYFPIATTGTWTKGSISTDIAPAGAVGLKIILKVIGGSTTSVLFDDVSVTEASAGTVAVTGVILNKSTLPLTTGNSESLIAAVAPDNATNKSVSWTSGNSAVATVDNTGKVIALAAGTANITVTTTDGSKTATCAVTVTAATVAVTSVTLNTSTLALVAGGSQTLTATVTPDNATNKSVTWSSNNTAVATVDNTGKVTALIAGTATITATTDGSKTATCAVTVTPATVAVTGVTLNKTTLALTAGASETLTATLAPDNATNKNVTWTSDNTAVATVDNAGAVTALTAGTATITVTTTDGSKTATCAVTVTAVAKTAQTISGLSNITKIMGDADFNLAATASSGLSVTYASSNTSVATISGSTVHIVGAGTTTITASQAGNGSYSAATPVTATLTVEGVKVSAIRLGLSLSQGSSAKLTATVSPSNASNTDVTWSSDNTSVASVDNNGNVRALSAGTAIITVASADGAKSVEFAITVDIHTANYAPIAESDFSFNVQPNPVTDEASFHFGLAANRASIVISDLSGKTVAIKTVATNSTSASINVSDLSNGMYIARYTDADGKQATVKMIK